MKQLAPKDIATGGSECHIGFLGLLPYYDEPYVPIEPSKVDAVSLTVKEIMDTYDVSPAVAEKLVAYQSGLLEGYRNEVNRFIGQVDRYNEIRSHLENHRLNKAVLLEYVENTLDDQAMLREFQPSSHLRNGLIGVIISYLIFFSAVIIGWDKNAHTWSDFVLLGIVALIWCGITTMIAWQLPGEYRTRKIIYGILKTK